MRRQGLVDQALVAIEIGKREIRAAGMVDADEGGVGDEVQALLAAIFGMRAPTDVAEETRCMAEPRFLGGLFEADRGEHLFRPGRELADMAWRARAEIGKLLAGYDQRVARFF